MLTKDHIKLRVRGERIFPEFLKGDDALTLDLESLLHIFHGHLGGTQVGLDRELAYRQGPLVGAFAKLIADQCEWIEANDRSASRAEWFVLAEKLRNEPACSYESFMAAMEDQTSRPFAELAQALYEDLPSRRILSIVPNMKPKDLIQRYNIAQVQAALLQCEEMILTFNNCDASALRPAFRAMKFHRLMPQVLPGKSGTFAFKLDGPMSLLSERNAYGVRFANFFPALLGVDIPFEVEAVVHHKKSRKKLKVTSKDGYQSHYSARTQYDPPEFANLLSAFDGHKSGVTLTRGNELVMLGDQICFPDFSLRLPSGETLQLELFHRWHKGPLLKRLDILSGLPGQNLLLGVEAKLAQQSVVRAALANSTWFQGHGFVFRDFPTPKSILDRVAKHC